LDLLLEFAKDLDDESRLQKIVPVIVGTFLNDDTAFVR
jgi:hypothetical protein